MTNTELYGQLLAAVNRERELAFLHFKLADPEVTRGDLEQARMATTELITTLAFN